MLLLDAIKSWGLHLHIVSILVEEANEWQGEPDSFCLAPHRLRRMPASVHSCPQFPSQGYCCSFRKDLKVEKASRGVALKVQPCCFPIGPIVYWNRFFEHGEGWDCSVTSIYTGTQHFHRASSQLPEGVLKPPAWKASTKQRQYVFLWDTECLGNLGWLGEIAHQENSQKK